MTTTRSYPRYPQSDLVRYWRLFLAWWQHHPASPDATYNRHQSQYEAPGNWWYQFERHDDPLMAYMANKKAYNPNQIYLGIDEQTYAPIYSERETAVLVVGRPGAEKTTSIIIPNALAAYGFLFSVSTRSDVFRATARHRARFGQVFHFSAVGTKKPGAISAYFSILQGCENNWGYCKKVALRIASHISRSEWDLIKGGNGHEYFHQRCADKLTALLYIAATWKVEGKAQGLKWLLNVVQTQHLGPLLRSISLELDGHDAEDMARAVDSLNSLLAIAPEELSATLNTISNALLAYDDPIVLAHSESPGIDLRALVRDSKDTLYITDANAEGPYNVINSEIEIRLREETYSYCEECEDAGLPKPNPVTILNDEGAGAPPAQLTRFLSDLRGRGVNFVLCIQSMSQARQLWGDIGADLYSLIPNRIVFPGSIDSQTVEPFSTAAGEYWHKSVGSSDSKGVNATSTGTSTEYRLEKERRVDTIMSGNSDSPDSVLLMTPQAHVVPVLTTPYYRTAPCLPMLVRSLELGMDEQDNLLPLPDLAQGGSYDYLAAHGLDARFWHLQKRYDELKGQHSA